MEIQIKIMHFHFTPDILAKVKKKDDTFGWDVGTSVLAQTVEGNGVFQESKL
jgi:hypothetical protein